MATVAKAVPQQPVVPRMAPREDLNAFRISQMQFDMAAESLKLDAGLRQILRAPRRLMEVSIPVKLDNGQVKVFTGFRVQHNMARGPAGGNAISPGGPHRRRRVPLPRRPSPLPWLLCRPCRTSWLS